MSQELKSCPMYIGLACTLTLHTPSGNRVLRLGITEMEMQCPRESINRIGSMEMRILPTGPAAYRFSAIELPPIEIREPARRRAVRAMYAD